MYLCKIIENPILIYAGSTILNIRLEEFKVVPVFTFRVDSEEYEFTGVLPRIANTKGITDLVVICALTKETVNTIEQLITVGKELELEGYNITKKTVVLPFKKLRDNYYLNLNKMYESYKD